MRVPTTGARLGMDAQALAAAIAADRAAGHLPAGIIACTGGTALGACDDIAAVAAVARAEGLYLHVDAAWAGAAMICPEFRHLWAGIEAADSLVLNPHKWLGAQFDCAAHFLRDPDALVRTLAIRPDYLRTEGVEAAGAAVDYSEWSVPLGRRFRALKLWFVLRAYGLEGLRGRIRDHVAWSQALCERLRAAPGITIASEPVLSLFAFRLARDEDTRALAAAINDDGRLYVTATSHGGRAVIRFQTGGFSTAPEDLDMAHDVITALARDIAKF